MTSFRFVHTADIHLDSPLKGLADYQRGAAERIRMATREAFDNLVSQVIDEEASFIIVSGDLYDGDWRDYQTGLLSSGRWAGSPRPRFPYFYCIGNHDAESQITRRLTLPENVKVFSTRKPETFELKSLGVALHGQGFGQRDIEVNLAFAYPEPIEKMFNIGVLHTGLGGLGGMPTTRPVRSMTWSTKATTIGPLATFIREALSTRGHTWCSRVISRDGTFVRLDRREPAS